MSHNSATTISKLLIRRIIREETGLTPVAPAEKWRGGELVLRPGKPGVQEKSWPIESFFNKVVMLRNRLRTLEQQVNASDLPDDQKLKIQGYITGCYGSLTSFNVLFADDDDRFVGAAADERRYSDVPDCVLRPGVFQRHGAVEDRRARPRIRIDREVAEPLELEARAGRRRRRAIGSSLQPVSTSSDAGLIMRREVRVGLRGRAFRILGREQAIVEPHFARRPRARPTPSAASP